jgi:hypothetical protein
MTQSEVPAVRSPKFGVMAEGGALSIGAFERSRWRLRRTRCLWVLNRFFLWLGERTVAIDRAPELVSTRPVSRDQWSCAVFEPMFSFQFRAWMPVWAHVQWACRSTPRFRAWVKLKNYQGDSSGQQISMKSAGW